MIRFVIWWTTQADSEAVSRGGTLSLPNYLDAEFRSRLGRNGRGRLWIAEEIKAEGCPELAKFPDTALANAIEEQSMAGIVIRRADVASLRDMPGVITDFELRRIEEA